MMLYEYDDEPESDAHPPRVQLGKAWIDAVRESVEPTLNQPSPLLSQLRQRQDDAHPPLEPDRHNAVCDGCGDVLVHGCGCGESLTDHAAGKLCRECMDQLIEDCNR